MILDVNGQPFDLTAAQRDAREAQTDTDPARLSWLHRTYDDHPARGLTPERLHQLMLAAEQGDLVGQLELCEDMEERDGHLFSELDKRAGAVASLPWSLAEPPGASAAEKSQTAQLRDWLTGLPDIDDLVRSLMTSVLRGFACVELAYSLQPDGSGRQVLLPSMALRPHSWFTVDQQTRDRIGLRQQGHPDGEPLRPVNWIVHQHRAKNGLVPRSGLCRVLAWPYLFKNFAARDLAELLEVYGLPVRIGKYPVGASPAEKAALLRAVVQIGHNAAGIIPMGMQMELLKAAEGGEGPFDSMQDRMEAVQSKVILGQTLTSGEGKHGTQALGTVHNDVRMDIRDDDAIKVAATITRQLLRPMALLNIAGANPARLPRFVLETAAPDDLKTYADALPVLVGVGFKVGRKWAQAKLQIPEPEEGEDVLTPAVSATAPMGGPGTLPPKPGAAAAHAALAAQPASTPRDEIDELVDDALADWRPLMEPIVEPLMAELHSAIAAGESAAAFAARLSGLAQRMDYAPLAEQLARASLVAHAAGAANIDP